MEKIKNLVPYLFFREIKTGVNMKKYLILILLGIIVLSGCTQNSEQLRPSNAKTMFFNAQITDNNLNFGVVFKDSNNNHVPSDAIVDLKVTNDDNETLFQQKIIIKMEGFKTSSYLSNPLMSDSIPLLDTITKALEKGGSINDFREAYKIISHENTIPISLIKKSKIANGKVSVKTTLNGGSFDWYDVKVKNLPPLEKFYSNENTSQILELCKCKDCWEEVYPVECLNSKAIHPQNCIDFVGVLIEGGDHYYTGSQKEECFNGLISRQNTTKLCASFPKEFQYSCFASVSKKNLDPEQCKDLPYSYKSDCYLHIARNKPNFELNLCDELNLENRITCYAYKASNKHDSDICLGLDDKSKKLNCYSQLDEHQGDFCSILNPCYEYNFRNYTLDKNLLDEEYCYYENVTGGKNASCLASLAIYGGSLGECNKIVPGTVDREGYTWQDYKSDCYFLTALRNNITFKDCDTLGIDWGTCYNGVILRSHDTSLCNNHTSPEMCYYVMVADAWGIYGEFGDISLCLKTGDRNLMETCFGKIYNPLNKTIEDCYTMLQIAGGINSNLEPGSSSDLGKNARKCFNEVAINTLNVTLCNDTFPEWQNDCIKKISHVVNN